MDSLPATSRLSSPSPNPSSDAPAWDFGRRGRARFGVLSFVLAAVLAVGLAQTASSSAAVPDVGPGGIDVASWQHPGGASINWSDVRASGQRFVLIKASQGTRYTNPYYAGDRRGALAAGLIVGAYDFADPHRTSVAEATHFLAVTGLRFGADTLPPVLDMEQSAGLRPAAVTAWALSWLRIVQRRTGRRPMIYSNGYFVTHQMTTDPRLARYRLWLASYSKTVPQTGPGAWARAGWTFWQYTNMAAVPGVAVTVDRSQFWGTQSTLSRLART